MELTYEDAQNNGIDTSMVKVCKKIRGLAKLDRLKLDTSTHRQGLNKHLFDYIEYCGIDTLKFVKNYLSNLQPYMIYRRKDQEIREAFICIIDNLYRVSIYIRIDATQFEEIVVSFHEDNKRGIAKSNRLQVDNRRFVSIFADTVLSKVENQNKYVIKALFQRGMLVLPLELAAMKCKDVFIVPLQSIKQQFVSFCNDYIRELYTSDLQLDFEKIEVFSVLQQISFTSYGRDTFSSVSLLIDNLNIQPDLVSRTAADFALVVYSQSLQLTDEQKTDLIKLLHEKYKVSDIKKIDIILSRIEDNLSISREIPEISEEALQANFITSRLNNISNTDK